ncbi:MAG: zf-HC2 domain-containing protein [Desulfomonile tiedjei]|uniref:Zf-HC2 domain-containing protein n=1 Tax=Desulfomonile tiedjei TaxID=2358 RepID=A0A9D6V6J0_9BACT|nr:zf-HC2 domain-containing protein [Desulfomonile tiedjei]
MNPIICREAEELIVEDLDEGLDPGGKNRLENHLQTCSKCVRMREDMRMMVAAASSDMPQDPNEDFWKSFDRGLEARIREREPAKRNRRLWQVALPALAAAGIIIAVFGLTIDRHHPGVGKMSATSDIVIDDVHQIFGPSRDELGPSMNSGITMVLNGVTDEAVVRWFEVEDESSQSFL